VWAAGSVSANPGVILHWDGNAWVTVRSPPLSGYLSSVFGSARSDVWAAGPASTNLLTALHWDGSSWTTVF
jgi:hypothetical protein